MGLWIYCHSYVQIEEKNVLGYTIDIVYGSLHIMSHLNKSITSHFDLFL